MPHRKPYILGWERKIYIQTKLEAEEKAEEGRVWGLGWLKYGIRLAFTVPIDRPWQAMVFSMPTTMANIDKI